MKFQGLILCHMLDEDLDEGGFSQLRYCDANPSNDPV